MSDAAQQLKDVFQSEQFKKILPYLVTGGVGATAGAYLSGARRKREGESRTSHVGRVLRNALLTGGLAAGATGLARYGASKLNNSIADNDKLKATMENPADNTLRAALFNPFTAIAAGGLGLAATSKLPGIGADAAGRKESLESIAKHLGTTTRDVLSESPKKLSELLRGVDPTKASPELLESLRRQAGLTTANLNIPRVPLVSKADIGNLGSKIVGGAKALGNKQNWLDALDKTKTLGKGQTWIDALDKTKTFGKSLGQGQTWADAGKKVVNAPGQLKQLIDNSPRALSALEGLRQTGSKFTRRGLSTFGQTLPKRGIRSGVGLAAALAPALIGAFMTKEKEN